MSLILIVEDEPRLAGLLSDYLQQDGFSTHCLNDGLQVIDWLQREQPALVLLDLMLPGKDGMAVCREIRAFSQVPIIMVTARIEEIDRLLGLEMGADDYICKPFSPREVVARVKAVLRRSSPRETDRSTGLQLDRERYRATLGGAVIPLTAIEFQLLCILAEQPGRIFSRNQLMALLYDDGRIVSDRTIDSHIKKLRKRIAEVQPDLDLIRSVYGAGYTCEFPD